MILVIFSITLQLGWISSFRLLVLVFGAMIILLNLRLKQLFLSTFLLTLFMLPLFNPNKYTTIEVIHGTEIFEPLYKEGYLLGYGLNITNIGILGSFLTLFLNARRGKINLINLLRLVPPPIIIASTGFLLVGLGTSINLSAFKEASVVWMLQYFQLFTIALLLIYYLKYFKREAHLLQVVFVVSIFFQFILLLRQFLNQSFIGLPIETGFGSGFATGLDEINTLFRVAGSLSSHNELALITLILMTFVGPHSLYTKNKWFILSLIAGAITIVLTQSRSVWIAAFIVIIVTVKMYGAEIRKWIKKTYSWRLAIFTAALVTLLSWVIVPRILLSANAVYEGAGIPARLRVFDEGMQAFVLNPWLGYGVGTNEYVLHSLFPNGITTVFPTAIHFGLLQLALEVGIVGVFCFLYPFIHVLRRLVNLKIIGATKTETKFNHAARYRFITGSVVFFIYYLFLPHVGIIEFPYLGLVLGYGLAASQKML